MAAGNGALDGWWVTMRPTLTNLCEVQFLNHQAEFFYRSTCQFSQGKWWYFWDGTLLHQPQYTFFFRGYSLGPNPILKGSGELRTPI